MALSGIELSAGIVVGVNKPVEVKYGTYADTATAISEIGESLRYQGLTVGVIEGGSVVEYWWKDGTADGDLVLKTSDGGVGDIGTSVTVVFNDSGSSLPLTTSTTIDSITITDGATVLVLDSATSGEVDNIYTASVDGTDISWTLLEGYGVDGEGVEGQIAYISSGTDGSILSATKRTTYFFDGTTWIKLTQAPLFAKQASFGTVADIVCTSHGLSYVKRNFLTVDKVFADTTEADAYYALYPDEARIYLNLDSMSVFTAYQLSASTRSSDAIDVTSQDFIIFCPEELKYYQYNGVDAVEAIILDGYATSAQGALADTALQNVVEDTTPQLGGGLDTQGNAITGNYPTDGRRATRSETTTTRTFALSDAGDMILFENASASTGTIPTNASVAFPVGTEIDIVWLGAGEVTIEADTGVTLNGVSAGSTVLTAQYGGATIKKIAIDTWLIFGKINDVA